MKKFNLLKVVTPVCLLAALNLTGCFGVKGTGDANTDKLDVTVDTRGTTISFWTGFGEKVENVLLPLIETFQEKTGIIVQYETKGGYANLQTAINLSATKKQYANVALGYPDHFAGYINSNIQLRLDGLIKNDAKRAVGKDKYGADIDKDGIRVIDYDDFYADYTKENETLEFDEEHNGYKLGLPFNKSSEVMVYNSQFFDWCADQAALANSIHVPSTWEEVKSVGLAVKQYFKSINVFGKALYSDGNVYAADPKIEGVKLVYDAKDVTEDGFRLLSYDSTENLFITLVRQFGGTFTELDLNVNGKGYAAFNDAAYKQKTLDAMDMWRDLDENKIVGIPATFDEQQYCSNPFKKGLSLLNIGSTGGLSNEIGSFAVSCTAIPQNGKLQNKFVISQGTNLALFDKGTEKERVAAWKLMVYLSQQANGAFAAGTGYFPTCDYAYESDEYQEYLDEALSAAELLAQEAAVINTNIYGNKDIHYERFVDPAFRGSSSIRTEVGFIPGYIMFSQKDYPNNQSILDAVYAKISDYVRK